ncbi:DNA repair protein complementing XP-C cells isoform X1 [Hemibagrus wyckioides]|uniref:DNA repair protein complementing XP-C cells isoform X1 n=2 Tax=Hemibagrus wyckioides TaxID=337641 RepID=UPI00266D1930|nr:DNA repair protein complementing XP-C cells isoform X1 [Hemibagrus wyckioides]
MAKHKHRAVATEKESTKEKIQAVKKRKAAPKTPSIKDKGTRAKTIAKTAKPRGQASKKARKPAAGKKSKYFSEPLKDEPEDIFEDSSTSLPESSVVKNADNKIKEEKKENESEESDEDEDWEEVEELAGPLGPAEEDQEPAVPSQPVEIEIETTEARHKRQKKENRQAELETYLRRMMKRFNKEVQEDTHKVHLLCLLASGLFRNRLCCEPDLLAITLSLIPSHFTMVIKKRINTVYLEGLLKWFNETFTLNPALPEEKDMSLRALLERRLGSLSARNHQEMTYLFLLVLRSLHLYCRLVLSLQPLSFKPPTKKEKAQTSSSPLSKEKSNEADKKPPEPKVSPGSKRPSSSSTEGQPKRGGKRQKRNVEDGGDKEKEAVGGQRPKNTKRRSTASKVSYKEDSTDGEEELSDGDEFHLSSEDDSDDSERGAKRSKKNSKAKGKGKSQAPRCSSKIKKRIKEEEEDDDEDEEEEEEEEEDLEEELEGKKQRRRKRQGKGDDEWIEVYLKGAKRWICVDVDQGVGQPELCSNQVTQPITYVVGVDDHGYLKDVSSRYDPTWLTASRKRRINSEWWEETLSFYECPDSEQKKEEDKELQAKLMDKPLPKAISEYKSHPLYALERHMLKYEALYPPTATILGYCRGEAVYSRDCVHTLHSRDTWLKQARTVRLGEKPYKMVKGFSNRSRKVRMMSENKDEKDLPLFGLWQTEEYQPPVAINGKIPRNDFGNVYMFQPSMLPVGCVHLHLPNLNRVARKLNLDCAPAVTGFDFHGGYSHAVTDGYIVCEEHEEILKAAWENEQEIQKKKEQEKREKRALANWKLLVKGLLIKERLQRRYGQQGMAKDTGIAKSGEEAAEGFSSGEEDEGGAHTAPPSLAVSWPQNRQEEQEEGGVKKSASKRERRGQQKHLFPFEKPV